MGADGRPPLTPVPRRRAVAGLGTLGIGALGLATLGLPAPSRAQGRRPAAGWRSLEQGLDWAEFPVPGRHAAGERITVVRADLAHFRFALASVKWSEGGRRTVREWAGSQGFVVAANAGLYATDLETNVGLMVDRDRVNNPRTNVWGAVLAFNPTDRSLPAAQIIDRRCQPFDRLRREYGSLVQNMRLIDCNRKSMWRPNPRRWPIAALAFDRRGRALFLFAERAMDVHDFIAAMLGLPLAIERAMYLEGGGPAQMYVHATGLRRELTGGFENPDGGLDPWPARAVPNALGLMRRRA